MKCCGCGAEISTTVKFCPKCGKPQRITAAMIKAAENGDQNAIADLYNRTYNSVYQTVKMLIRDEDTVLDVVQDSYIKAFQSLEQLDSPDSFSAWIKRIATNKAKDYLKKKKPVLFTELSNDEDTSPEYTFQDDRTENLPDQVIDQQETTRLIDEILNTLSDEQRLVIGMFYYEQMSVKEIAESVGCSENTVKSRLNYGRKKIEAKVLELEKQGTKLYSLAPLPFLLWLFKGMAKQAIAAPSEVVLHAVQKECATLAASAVQTGIGEAAAQRLTEKTVETVAKEVVKSATAETVAKATAGTAVKAAAGAASKAVVTKVTAAILAVALIGGGATTAVVVHNKNKQPEQPSSVEMVEESISEPQEQTTPTPEIQTAESPLPTSSTTPDPTNEADASEDPFEVYAPNSTIRVLDADGNPYMNGYVLGYTYVMTEISSGGGAGEYQVQAGSTFELPTIGYDGETVELDVLFDFDKEKTLTKYVRFEAGATENEIVFIMPADGVFPEPQQLPLPTTGSGQCGDNINWTYDNGTLTLTGTGETWYMVGGEGNVPWATVCHTITDIVIGDGITYLSPYIFSGYPLLETVCIPTSVNEIAYGAFSDSPETTQFFYSGNRQQWETINIDNTDEYNTILFSDANIHFAEADAIHETPLIAMEAFDSFIKNKQYENNEYEAAHRFALVDIDGDGSQELLSALSIEPYPAGINGDHILFCNAAVYGFRNGKVIHLGNIITKASMSGNSPLRYCNAEKAVTCYSRVGMASTTYYYHTIAASLETHTLERAMDVYTHDGEKLPSTKGEELHNKLYETAQDIEFAVFTGTCRDLPHYPQEVVDSSQTSASTAVAMGDSYRISSFDENFLTEINNTSGEIQQYVGLARQERIDYIDGVGNVYDFYCYIPYFLIDSEDAQRCSEEIATEWGESIDFLLEAQTNKTSCRSAGIHFEAWVKDGIFNCSILSGEGIPLEVVSTYTFDINTGEKLANAEIARRYGLDSNYRDRIRATLEAEFEEKNSYCPDVEIYNMQYEKTVSDENISNVSLCPTEDGKLMMLCRIYSCAGGSSYTYYVPLR